MLLVLKTRQEAQRCKRGVSREGFRRFVCFVLSFAFLCVFVCFVCFCVFLCVFVCFCVLFYPVSGVKLEKNGFDKQRFSDVLVVFNEEGKPPQRHGNGRLILEFSFFPNWGS